MMRLALLFLFTVACAFAQLNSAELRAKFGAPVDRETFRVPPGFDLVVDYGIGATVCRIEVPSLMPSDERVQNLEVMSRRMYDFLAKLIPETMRGKELGRRAMMDGINILLVTDYENMTITEPRRGSEPFETTTITVRFKNPSCESSQ